MPTFFNCTTCHSIMRFNAITKLGREKTYRLAEAKVMSGE